MSMISALAGTKTLFPEIVTNEFINNMPRRELTETEKSLLYAKYYYKDMALIPDEDLAKVNAGPIDSALALPIEDCAKMLDEGYLPTETGFCVMPDGSGFAATKVFMPDVTPQMLDWWFNWHPLEGLRYAIWCPVAHVSASAKTPDAHRDSCGVPLSVRNIGKIHYPIEGFDLDGAQTIEIAFRHPEVLGITMEQIEKSPVKSFAIATCATKMGHIPINVLFHSAREVPGGVEFRSRYWLKHTIKHDKPVLSRLPIPTREQSYYMARCNCIHSLTEYNNLASILPALYREYNGQIK